MAETHEILGGEVLLYKRDRSRFWQCSTYMGGRNRRVSTGEESLSHAKDCAEDWYLELRGKLKSGELAGGKLFKEVADQFLKEYEIITEGNRNRVYVEGHKTRLRIHLIPFFGHMGVKAIKAGHLQEYRIQRRAKGMDTYGKPPARNAPGDRDPAPSPENSAASRMA